MKNIILKLFKRKIEPEPEIKVSGWAKVSENDAIPKEKWRSLQNALNKSIQVNPIASPSTPMRGGMDSVVARYGYQSTSIVPDALFSWYASQGFIGYQTCAILAQHWLVSKACSMPAEDATRNGYKITVNDGTEIDPEILEEMRKADLRFNMNGNLQQFVHMGNVFGIRIAMFIIDTPDPENYYSRPFNPDGITPGSYRGISQIDPYWMSPMLDGEAAANPLAKDFYEPTWWQINGLAIHRSHLIIYRTKEVPDILKPTYVYGGVPLPQEIYEHVYNAERTAAEAPMLAMTKRLDVLKVDIAAAVANEGGLSNSLAKFAAFRDNYGTKVIDRDDDMLQFDTSLSDLDDVIMSQFQLVSAVANVPATKLLGTSPKGFNTTGEFEEANYHEHLESLQSNKMSALVERHHLILIRSEIAPLFGIKPFSTEVVWNPLDAMTAKELAETNKMKAETGQALVSSGAIDGMDERQRITNDPESGYDGLNMEEVLSDPEDG